MKIGFFSKESTRFIGAIRDNRVMNLTAVSWQGDHPFLQRLTDLFHTENFSTSLFEMLYEDAKDREDLWHDLAGLSFVPLYRPGKIICLGLNYEEHAAEAGRTRPEEPIYFEKAVTAMAAHDQPIVYPDGLGRIDPEAELAVIIGKRAKNVELSAAAEYIAGYTILNDVTARDMQSRDVQNRLPWYRSKSLDTFCPVGPWIVTANEIDPLEPLRIRLMVNGEVRQEGSTGDLIFDIPSLIARISSLITLESGDIISTGTPSGIAPIYPGDVVEIEVEKIGVLRNPVAGSTRSGQ
jgi:5-oxopent-3-ene-1,2,5-tricarboxylate decarboxylase/2-hydroxyhepta-2,4-diene-1,7-dioate isomerase